jgi:hypothetical protein
MKRAYVSKRFGVDATAMLDYATVILAEYARQGLSLTLRQLYYQFVARGWLANTERNYKRLGTLISDGRLAGLIDWEAIEDRTRNSRGNPHWLSPNEIVRSCAAQYQIDKWAGQEYRVEVWVEKEALAGVLAACCPELDVTQFSCRGYVSQSEMWVASQRLLGYAVAGQQPVVVHLGDHDPSGIDMTRDIEDRLALFVGSEGYAPPIVNRIALTWEQIEEHAPPPNPAKATDSRYQGYKERYGEESWELDALDPPTLIALIRATVGGYRDEELWQERMAVERAGREALAAVAEEMGV